MGKKIEEDNSSPKQHIRSLYHRRILGLGSPWLNVL